MSYSTRDLAQRRMKQSIGNIDTALGYLAWFETEYRGEHEELADIALIIADMLMQSQDALKTLAQSF